jgi:hypothetical protein
MFISLLTIAKISTDHDGKFKVTLKNDLGEALSATQVNVKRSMHFYTCLFESMIIEMTAMSYLF